MFLAEMIAGQVACSQALQADALDFRGYGDLRVEPRSDRAFAQGARPAQGMRVSVLAAWVLGSTIYRTFVLGVSHAELMGDRRAGPRRNVRSVLLLMRYKDGDANVRSVWLCSRNDAIGNVVVLIAAAGVWGTAWPDLGVAALMAGVFLTSSVQILRLGWAEHRDFRRPQPVAAQ
jgi:Co/Zn/Cd efflux system component